MALDPVTDQFSQFLRLAFLRSPNFLTGVSGWTINQDGSAEFNNVTVRGTVIASHFVGNGNGQEILIYSGPPAAGNLVASVCSAAGTDSHTNAFLSGFVTYPLVGAIHMAVQSGGGVNPGVTLYTAASQAGPYSVLSSYTGDQNGNLNISSQAGNAVNVIGGKLVSTAGTAANPTLIQTDTWQTLGTLAGYTVQIGRFRLTPNNELELDIKCTGGGAQAQTVSFSVTLPAAYRPLTQHDTLPMGTTKAIAAGDIWPRLLVTTAGVVTVNATPNSATVIATCVRIPLD